MKKHFFKYKRNKMLLWLTLLLIICLGIIIRGSEFPLIKCNNFMDKYMELLFLSSSRDRTLYNIGISYVAAYIFYIVQIYIPAVSDHDRGFRLTRGYIEDYVNDVKKLMLVTDNLLKKRDWRKMKTEDYCFYIIESSTKMIFRITYRDSYQNLKEQILEKQNEVLANPLLNNLDDNLIELLCMLQTKELFAIADNIYEQINRSTNVEIWDYNVLEELQKVIDELQDRYGYAFETFALRTI